MILIIFSAAEFGISIVYVFLLGKSKVQPL
jgi:hypothetical protein